MLDLEVSEQSLPCQREGDRVSGGGIRSTTYEFAEVLGEFGHFYRMNPPPINCFKQFIGCPL